MKYNLTTFLMCLLLSANVFSVPIDIKIRSKNFRDPFKKNYGKRKSSETEKKKVKTNFSNKFDISSIFIEDIKIPFSFEVPLVIFQEFKFLSI